MFAELIKKIRESAQPAGRANAIAGTMLQLQQYVPAGIDLSAIVAGWQVLSTAKDSDDALVAARRQTCAELVKLSGVQPVLLNISVAKACWAAWVQAFETLSGTSGDSRQTAMFQTFRRELEEISNFTPEFVKGREIEASQVTKYSQQSYRPDYGILDIGKEWRNKWGNNFKTIFYAIQDGERFYMPLVRIDSTIRYGKSRNDQWDFPDSNNSSPHLLNSAGEIIGYCCFPGEYGTMPGWKQIGIRSEGYGGGSPEYLIIQSPEGELFKEL